MLPKLAIRYRPIVITVVVMLMAWGVVSFQMIPRREDPEYTVRACVVTAAWPGAPAGKVEELVTDKLEQAIDTIEEVKIVRSTSMAGNSTIIVETEDTVTGQDINNVWDKVRARVANVDMPEPGLAPIVNDQYGDTSILLLAVYQTPLSGAAQIEPRNRYTPRQLDVISDRIKDELRLLAGVAKSERYGVRDEAIYVEADMGTWSNIDLTVDQLESLVQKRNIVAPGGNIDTNVGRFAVKPGGELDTVGELNSILVGDTRKDGQTKQVYLKDLGLNVVRDYEDPPRQICRYGDAQTSEPCVIVALTMKSGANIVDICEAAKARVREMQSVEQSLPPDIAVTPVSDQSVNVARKIEDVIVNVIAAIIIIVAVVFLAVGFRTAWVMAANIPVVVLAALALMPVFGVQLEQVSLASIIIALGLLVDNAVQVCDQSRTNQIRGMPPVRAAVKGSQTLTFAMLGGTATTVAAFLPMLIGLKGKMREYVYSLPVTLTLTLAASWLLAMTFCTILAAAFIRAPKGAGRPSAPLPWMFARALSLLRRRKKTGEGDDNREQPNFFDKVFRKVCGAAVKAKFVTVGIAVLLLMGALMLPVESEFFPKDFRDQFAVAVWLPENATIQQTDAVAQQVEEMLRQLSPARNAKGETVQRISAMRTMVGGGGSRWYLSSDPEPAKPNYAEILVRTSDPKFTPELVARLREIARHGDRLMGIAPTAGARIVPKELFLGPSKPPVEIRVFGPGFADENTLRSLAGRVKNLVRSQPGTWDVHDTWGVAGFQLRVDVDQDRANLAGVTNLQVAQTLNAYFSGHHLSTFREGDHLVPVYFRLKPEQRGTLDGLSAAYVQGNHRKVPLESIARIEPRWETARIERRNLNRVIEVRAEVEPGVLGNDVVKRIMASPEMKQLQAELPPGYRIEVGGALEKSYESSQQLGLSLSISILAIVLILVIQYNGWAKPMIILATLPLALTGALAGLWITNNPLGFMPQLGILSLFGIVLNTGIIFIEFADLTIKRRAEASDGSGPVVGLTRKEFRDCLVEAGRQRLLPIFLTTATTIGGLLPLALFGGPLWEGVAWCMIFGLIVATMLTLLVVPTLYAIFVENFRVRPVRLDQSKKTE